MIELWKDIDGYDGRYQVSNLGRLKSVERQTSAGNYLEERILKQRMDSKGYLRVNLAFDGAQKTVAVHRLVALAFVDKPDGLNVVNHKDENKLNNRADNFEWCTTQYNISYGTAPVRRMRRMEQRNKNGELIRCWQSAAEIQTTLGFNQGNIGHCARGKYRYAYGYRWAYAER